MLFLLVSALALHWQQLPGPGLQVGSDSVHKLYTVTPAMKLEGHLKPQFALDKAVKLIDGEFDGAESIILNADDDLIFGTAGGKIIKIKDGENNQRVVTIVTEYEKPCEKECEKFCGPTAPLGIRIDADGNLVLADGNHGIFVINPTDGRIVTRYVTMDTLINGKPAKFANDLDIGKDGSIYWSDVSSEFKWQEFSLDKIGDSTGRLNKYDPATNTHTQLFKGLFGANGVQLSENEDFVLVGESFSSRVSRYYLKGPKAGTNDIFIDGLPGLVDNIRPNGKGGFYVALISPRAPLIDEFSQHPEFRRLLFSLQWTALLPFKLLDQIGYGSSYISSAKYYINSLGPLGMNWNAKPVLLDVNATGHISRVLTTSSNLEFRQLTQIIVGEKYAYMGSLSLSIIWKISLDDLNSNSAD